MRRKNEFFVRPSSIFVGLTCFVHLNLFSRFFQVVFGIHLTMIGLYSIFFKNNITCFNSSCFRLESIYFVLAGFKVFRYVGKHLFKLVFKTVHSVSLLLAILF